MKYTWIGSGHHVYVLSHKKRGKATTQCHQGYSLEKNLTHKHLVLVLSKYQECKSNGEVNASHINSRLELD